VDYTSVSGTLVFSSTRAEVSFSVPIIDDSDAEGEEDFLGRLMTSEDRVDIDPNTITVQILDDEGIHKECPHISDVCFDVSLVFNIFILTISYHYWFP